MPGHFLRRGPYDISGEPDQKRARSAREADLLARENPLLSVREIGSGSISYAAQQQKTTKA